MVLFIMPCKVVLTFESVSVSEILQCDLGIHVKGVELYFHVLAFSLLDVMFSSLGILKRERVNVLKLPKKLHSW